MAQAREEPAFGGTSLRELAELVFVAARAPVVPVHGPEIARYGPVAMNGPPSRRSCLNIGRASAQQQQKQHESTQHIQGVRE